MDVRGRVWAPAIALVVIASLGLLVALFDILVTILFGLLLDAQGLAAPRFRPLGAAVYHAICVIPNGCILFGAVQMMRFKSWGWAQAASVLAIFNIGSGCCILGIPVGVWSLNVLGNRRVKQAFGIDDADAPAGAVPPEPGIDDCPWCETRVIPDEDGRCPACGRPI